MRFLVALFSAVRSLSGFWLLFPAHDRSSEATYNNKREIGFNIQNVWRAIGNDDINITCWNWQGALSILPGNKWVHACTSPCASMHLRTGWMIRFEDFFSRHVWNYFMVCSVAVHLSAIFIKMVENIFHGVTHIQKQCRLKRLFLTETLLKCQLPIASSIVLSSLALSPKRSSNPACAINLFAACMSTLSGVLSSPSISVNATHAAHTDEFVKCCTATRYAFNAACCILW